MDALRRLVRALRLSSSAVERRTGISGAQLFVLAELGADPGQALGELVERTLTRQSTVSGVVAALVERGLVRRERSPRDRRLVLLSPTPAGRALLRTAPRTAQGALVEGLARLPLRQRKALADGLDAWLAAAGFAETAPAMFFEASGARGASG